MFFVMQMLPKNVCKQRALDLCVFVVCFCGKHQKPMSCLLLQTAMDQLHMHFASAIHNTAFTIVLGYVELCAGTAGSNFQKRQYPDLCKVSLLFSVLHVHLVSGLALSYLLSVVSCQDLFYFIGVD